jgi:hypothetical protein
MSKIKKNVDISYSMHDTCTVILERKKSGSDPGKFHYAMITDAQ